MWMLSEYSEREGLITVGVFKKVENAMSYAQEDSGSRAQIQWSQVYSSFKGEISPGKGWMVKPITFMDRHVDNPV